MALTKIKADGLTADLIDETKLADNSIDSEHYNDGSIDEAHIADDAVTADKLANAINTDIAAKAVLTGSTNNTITTVTGANAIQGEANLTFDGTDLAVGAGGITATANLDVQGTIFYGPNNKGRIYTDNNWGTIFQADKASPNNAEFMWQNAGDTERLRIDNSGNLKINDGDLVIGTSGHGIDFSATSAPTGTGSSGTSELFADYEEGTFTPTYLNISTPNYNNNTGKYTRIGRYVHCEGTINITDGSLDTSDASTVAIGSLPYAGAATHESCLFTLGRYLTILPQSVIDGYTNARFTGGAILLHEGSADGIRYSECNSSGILQFSLSYQI